ncbi:MAG: mechanosensitive ion channel family protein [Opitutaceae bacterium]|nr:mechanosensitive ion channel family protein [Opitutaceae bacterium]
MPRFLLGLILALAGALPAPCILAADAPAEAVPPGGTVPADTARQQLTTAAGAAVASGAAAEPKAPDFLEHLVDLVLALFDVRSSGNTVTHYVISSVLFIVALLARRIVTLLIFPMLRRLAAKTATTLDDKLFPALESPAAAFVMVVGLFASLKVLKLPPELDTYLPYGSKVAFSLVIFWGLWRALAAVLEHVAELARVRSSAAAGFMPWIKKSVLTVFVVVGALLTIESLGYDVKAILAGLGIGGLAFALAAQDTLANIFGAIVVAVDQPFRIGETVRIGGNVGMVEDIGLRSTRMRLADKSLMVIPNKTVASDSITNLSRFTRRRVEQVIGLTYDTTPAQLEELVVAIRQIICSQPEVDAASVQAYFRDFSASSLDIWLVYELSDPSFQEGMGCRQRVNLEIMRAVEKRGLSFAFPTQTVHVAGAVGAVEKRPERG